MTSPRIASSWIESAGLLVSEIEPGVLRGFDGRARGPRVLLVIRGGRITYAEVDRRVFAFWPTDPYPATVERLYAAIRELPA